MLHDRLFRGPVGVGDQIHYRRLPFDSESRLRLFTKDRTGFPCGGNGGAHGARE
jgi:hypothetical protein